MEERARRLARPAAEVRGSGDTLEIVVFGLASERYAVENRYVREVVRLADLAPVPGAPEFMAGVTNLRGEILAVVDLRRFFGVPARGITDTSRVVVLGADEAEFGVLAGDGVEFGERQQHLYAIQFWAVFHNGATF